MINDSEKQELIQEQSVKISNKYNCQTGILTPFQINEHALYIINFDDINVQKACKTLPELKQSISQSNPDCRLEITLGIGFEKTQQWLKQINIPIPKNLLQFKEKKGLTGKTMPNTGGDLLIHIRSNRKDLCFQMGLQFCQLIPDECIDKLDDTFGFAYMSSIQNGLSKDFIDFEDGNDNPKNDESRAKAALIEEGEDDQIHIGGSFALTQKWKHNLTKWNQLSQKEQENIIGRTKGENSQKIKPLDHNSHLAKTDLKDNGIDIKVVRQSLPYGGIKEHGLVFISYASNTHKHEKQLDSMCAIQHTTHDKLMDFSTPITGNYWFIPSIRLLKTLFYLI